MKYYKPNAIISTGLKQLSKLIIAKHATLTLVDTEKINIEPPYLIISNHVNNLDPLFINMMFDEPISYVVSDRFYKSKLLGGLLKYTGAISKTKGRMDLQTIRDLKAAVGANRIIGLFPEGMRTWDGKTIVNKFELAKLCKMLKVPLVLVHIKGGHFNQPRWSDKYYKNHVQVEVKEVISLDEIMSQPIDSTNKKIKDIMTFNEQNEFSPPIPLKGIDRLLNYCVTCHGLDTLQIEASSITCSACDTKYDFKSYSYISHPIGNVSNWLEQQTKHLHQLIEDKTSDFELETLRYQFDLNRKLIGRGLCNIRISNGLFYINGQRVLSIDGINIQNNDKLEFVSEDTIHWLIMSPQQHIYMWHTLLKALKGLDYE